MRQRCGLIPEIFNEGDDAEDMRHLAEELLRACDEPIISTAEYEYEPGDDDDDDDE